MANCPICGHYMKAGTFNTHHLWFPKARFKGTRRGRLTVPVHIKCHNDFNYFFTHDCHRAIPCVGCRYIKVCCYAESFASGLTSQ